MLSHRSGSGHHGLVGGRGLGPAVAGRILLEREREIGALEGVLSDAGTGSSGLLLVEGPAGIGKSCLIDELRERARGRGFRELVARGGDLEQEFPFGIVRQLFEPALARPDSRERLLTGAAASAGTVFEAVGAAPTAAGHDGSFAALHGLYWLTVNLAEDGPVLLVVDDVHWCDRPSLRFLAYLARRLDGLEVLVALGLRTAEPGTDPALIGELAGAAGALAVRPRALGGQGVADLIRCRLGADGDPAFGAACLEATGGNPLLLGRLLGVLADDGVPPCADQVPAVRRLGARAVSRTVLTRLGRLPDDATAVARSLAVLGDGTGLPVVALLAGLEEQQVASATAWLARAEIVRPEPPLAFVHPLVRDAVYHALPPGERELRHGDAARLLADTGAPADEVATHLLVAPRRGSGWTVDVLQQAARSARHRGAPDSAVAYLARALEEPPSAERRGAVLFELGMAATPIDGPLAVAHVAAADRELTDPRCKAEAALARAQSLYFTSPPEEGVAVVRRAAADVPPELGDLHRALQAVELLGVTFGAPQDVTEDRREAARSLGGPDGGGADGRGARMLAAIAAWDWALTGGSAQECSALARRALAGGEIVDGDCFLAVSAVTALVLADDDGALDGLDAIEAEGHRRGSAFAVNAALLFRGRVWLARGELADAETSLRKAAELAVLWGGDASWEAPELASVLIARGDPVGAREALDGVRSISAFADSAHRLRHARTELYLAQGRHADALAAADDLAAHLRHITNPAFAPWRTLRALALDGLGRTAEAVDLVREELPLVAAWGAPGAVGRTLRILGTLQRERGVDRLHEAVAMLGRSSARLEHARALHALGAALRRARRPSDARDPLARALELAEHCGADGLGAQIRTELYAAGGRPRVSAVAGPAALTTSERRVAELAAAGRTNKDIAQALYVTVKTVEVHLSRTYRKLGISSRHELGPALSG